MLKMQDIMKPVRWTIRSDDSLATAEWIMSRRRQHHLLVVDAGKLAGFLSDRDVLDFRADTKGQDQWWREPVSRAMEPVPVTAGPDEPVSEAAQRLAESPVEVLPIVERGFVLGQVRATDLLEAELWPVEPPPKRTTAADVMTEPVLSVKPTDSLLDAAALMVEHGIRHLPVIEEDAVVGMLSDRDIRTIAGAPARLLDPIANEGIRGLNVRDAMATRVVTVRGDKPLSELAHELADDRIGALPVVDDAGKLVGIVSYLDALNALA